MSLVTDMSDQCRIIESIIIYCDWIFSGGDTDPPALSEAEIKTSVAPISETMSSMSADLAAIAGSKYSSSLRVLSTLVLDSIRCLLEILVTINSACRETQ